MAMTVLLKAMKVGATVKRVRSTFQDWASEQTSFPHEVCEMALAHTIGNRAEAAYRRSDLFERRKTLMEAWLNFTKTTDISKPVQINKNNFKFYFLSVHWVVWTEGAGKRYP